MIARVHDDLGLWPRKLIGDTGYGSADMLAWLVNERDIEPHIPVFDRPDLARKLIRTKQVRKIPVVLTMAEVKRLLDATRCLKHQAALSVAYGAGLRVAEVAALKISDVDSKRMLLLASARRKNHLERARRLLDVAPAPPDDPPVEPEVGRACPCCGGTMIIIEVFERRYQPRAPPPPSLAPGIPAP